MAQREIRLPDIGDAHGLVERQGLPAESHNGQQALGVVGKSLDSV